MHITHHLQAKVLNKYLFLNTVVYCEAQPGSARDCLASSPGLACLRWPLQPESTMISGTSRAVVPIESSLRHTEESNFMWIICSGCNVFNHTKLATISLLVLSVISLDGLVQTSVFLVWLWCSPLLLLKPVQTPCSKVLPKSLPYIQ